MVLTAEKAREKAQAALDASSIEDVLLKVKSFAEQGFFSMMYYDLTEDQCAKLRDLGYEVKFCNAGPEGESFHLIGWLPEHLFLG